MNMIKTNVFVCLATLALAATSAQAAITTYSATTDDRSELSSSGYTGGNPEKVVITSSEVSGTYDPRVERFYGGSGSMVRNQGVYTFTARFKVESANYTTIAQILDYDASSSDIRVPMLFLVASEGTANDGRWTLYNGNPERPGATALTTVAKTSTFSVKITSNGSRLKLWINGNLEVDKAYSRIGDSSNMRYGAYHHGAGRASVLIYDARFQRDSSDTTP